jgi:hypothetical protein
MELVGRGALVTGGASGIGAAIAADLQAAGARVAIADRERAQIIVDLSQPGAARRMVAEAVETLSELDVLVNNAGGYSSPTYPDGLRGQCRVVGCTRTGALPRGRVRGCNGRNDPADDGARHIPQSGRNTRSRSTRVDDGRITSGREYWVLEAYQEPGAERARWFEPM